MAFLSKIESQIAKLEKEVKAAPPQRGLGIYENMLLSADGGIRACGWEQEPIGGIDPEDLESGAICVIAHPDSDIPIKTTEWYCNRKFWFPDRRYSGDYFLRCQLYGECPIEAITIGYIRPAFTSVDTKTMRVLAPWSDWSESERTVSRLDGLVLPREWTSFTEIIAEITGDQFFYDYWIEEERRQVQAYQTHFSRGEENQIKKLQEEVQKLERQIEFTLTCSYEKPVLAGNAVKSVLQEYVEDGRRVTRRRLLIGSGTDKPRMATPEDQKLLDELEAALQETRTRLERLKSEKPR